MEITENISGRWQVLFDEGDKGIAKKWFEPRVFEKLNPEPVDIPCIFTARRMGSVPLGWYMTRIRVPDEWKEKHIFLRFRGASAFTDAWLNGTQVGHSDFGYAPFEFQLDHAVRFNARNILIVRSACPSEERMSEGLNLKHIPHAKQSWYYNFSGIWGDVELVVRDVFGIEDCFVEADPDTGAIRIRNVIRYASFKAKGHPSGMAKILEKEVRVRYSVRYWKGERNTVFRSESTLNIVAGENRSVIDGKIHNPKLWDLWKPELYVLEVKLVGAGGRILDRKRVRFGFRNFEIRDGRFFLNGRQCMLKGLIFQPYFPETIVHPRDRGYFRRLLKNMKAANANILRVHVRTAAKELLDLADENGLLIYEEPTLGWIGYSHRMRELAMESVSRMVVNERNHPCIVLWGICNENSGDLWTIKGDLCLRARELDPSRIVLDDSGGWSRAAYLFPHSREWVFYADMHAYYTYPLREYERQAARSDIRAYGDLRTKPGCLNLISEYGHGGLSDFEKMLPKFKNKDAADFREYTELLARALAFFDRAQMGEIFANFSAMVEAGQEIQANAALVHTKELRSNEALAGFIYTQYQDAGYECSAGVVDIWNRPKKVHAALREAFADVALLFSGPRHSCFVGDEIDFDVCTVNDSGKDLTGELEISVCAGNRIVLKRRKIEISMGISRHFRFSCGPGSFLSAGTHHIEGRIRLTDGSEIRERYEVLVLPTECSGELPGAIVLTDDASELEDFFRTREIRALPLEQAGPGSIVIVPDLETFLENRKDIGAPLKTLEDLAKKGSRILVLCVYGNATALTPTFETVNVGKTDIRCSVPGLNTRFIPVWAEGIFCGKFHYLKKHPFFIDLDPGRFVTMPFLNVFPNCVLYTDDPQGCIAGTVGAQGAWEGGSLFCRGIGDGQVCFSQFQLVANLKKDSVAVRMLENMLAYLSRRF